MLRWTRLLRYLCTLRPPISDVSVGPALPKQCRVTFRSSESLHGCQIGILMITANVHGGAGNYGPPPGFNWDWGQGDPQIQVGYSSSVKARQPAVQLATHWCLAAARKKILLRLLELSNFAKSSCLHDQAACTTMLEGTQRRFCLQDDPRLHDVNVKERVDRFVDECNKIFKVTRNDDIMLTMGTDFTVSRLDWIYCGDSL